MAYQQSDDELAELQKLSEGFEPEVTVSNPTMSEAKLHLHIVLELRDVQERKR